MSQKFYDNGEPRHFPNGAIGYAPGGFTDCLGHFARVSNCPIDGTSVRHTCYASGYADTWFSVPATTRHKGKHVKGFFTSSEDGPVFNVMNSHKHLFEELRDLGELV